MRPRTAWTAAVALLGGAAVCGAACGGAGGAGGTQSVTLTAISVAPANPTIASGRSRQMTATGLYSDSTQTNVSAYVAWGTSDAGIVSITGTGMATGHAGGSAQVVATLGAVSGSTLVTVDPPIVGSTAVPKTGVTQCFDDWGSFIGCAGTGQDGELQRGVAWPIPRFVDHGDGTVTDTLSGLMWLQNADCKGQYYPRYDMGGTPYGDVPWEEALAFVTSVNSGSAASCAAGRADWRLPNVNELETLVASVPNDTRHPVASTVFTRVCTKYWSSTYYSAISGTTYAYGIANGAVTTQPGFRCVWPVRTDAAVTAPPAAPWRTGRTSCNAGGAIVPCSGTGQDGELQRGIAWPSPRFVDKGDGTVVDRLTGLVWLENANCFGSPYWLDALAAARSLASGACGLTDGSIPGDWRLPNRKELLSLLDYSQANPALPPGNPFSNVAAGYYHTSTTWMPGLLTADEWVVSLRIGEVVGNLKRINGSAPQPAYVWPVRGGP